MKTAVSVYVQEQVWLFSLWLGLVLTYWLLKNQAAGCFHYGWVWYLPTGYLKTQLQYQHSIL
jgi:hypothetical protein